MKKNPRGRPKYKPTDEIALQINEMAACGITQEQIAMYFNIDVHTMLKYYKEDFKKGKMAANLTVAKALYHNAVVEGDVTAQIWWTKSQMGFSEKKVLEAQITTLPIPNLVDKYPPKK